jgi:hypothetical protein
MTANSMPSQRGWYPDPYVRGQIRYFDGTEWTAQAVDAKTANPDEVIERDWDARSPDDASVRWREGFPKWDVDIPRGSEPPFTGGGWQGLYADRVGRFGERYPARFWYVCLLLFVFLVLAALVDPSQRPVLLPLLGLLIVVYVTTEVFLHRRKKHWKRVGQDEASSG